MNFARVHLIIRGRVQGVGYRYFAHAAARDLGLLGWVRNRLRGTVELVAEGERAAIERLLPILRQGPPSSRVDEIEVSWLSPEGEFIEFRIHPTG